MKFKLFQSLRKTWKQMAKEAADFAAALPPGKLVNISHACDPEGYGTVVVWYRK